jgi:hypothetical protein
VTNFDPGLYHRWRPSGANVRGSLDAGGATPYDAREVIPVFSFLPRSHGDTEAGVRALDAAPRSGGSGIDNLPDERQPAAKRSFIWQGCRA